MRLARELEDKLGQARSDFLHLDATIRIFDPTYCPELIAVKKTRERSG